MQKFVSSDVRVNICTILSFRLETKCVRFKVLRSFWIMCKLHKIINNKKLTNWRKKHCHFKHVSFNSFPLLGKMFLLKHFSGIACRWTFSASFNFNFHFWLEQSRGFEEVGASWLAALLAPFQFHNFTSSFHLSFPFICIFTCKWMEMKEEEGSEEGRRFFR